MDLATYEQIIPNVQAEGLTWITPNQHVAWRINTIQTKEPDTYAWIRSMEPGDLLFDIGANIGQYALLAASRGVRVHAFEPEAQNFALLVRNISVNKLSERCTAWPVALSDHLSMEILHLANMSAGGSCHSYGDNISYSGQKKDFPFSQGSISTTLDHFCARYGYPSHIKIDVDGFEHKVLQGGAVTLRNARSVLVETNMNYPDHTGYIIPRMKDLGFTYDEEQVEAARRKEGPFTGVGNWIWWRE